MPEDVGPMAQQSLLGSLQAGLGVWDHRPVGRTGEVLTQPHQQPRKVPGVPRNIWQQAKSQPSLVELIGIWKLKYHYYYFIGTKFSIQHFYFAHELYFEKLTEI